MICVLVRYVRRHTRNYDGEDMAAPRYLLQLANAKYYTFPFRLYIETVIHKLKKPKQARPQN
jgi:hypothetical protein